MKLTHPHLTPIFNPFFISLFLCLLIIGPPAKAQEQFPTVTCENAWLGTVPNDYLFDYSKDAKITPRGNEGYSNYLERMSAEGLVNRKDCYKTWTVFIYMAATQDLLPYAYADLKEMESGETYDGTPISSTAHRGSSLKSDVIVQLDSDTSREISRLHMFEGFRLGRVS